ncbi:type II secretion system F family protein [Nonomuraea sp. NPDC050556]|uniref:type II secretion system F family protein n=1 Tax=Nonomuraea sp. NPDC050556 TaxID=3364369 RepID=UPI0037A2B2E5
MLVLLAVLSACTATWMWIAPQTPEERLRRMRPRGTDGPPEPPEANQTAPAWLNPTRSTRRGVDRRTVTWAACAGLLTALLIGGVSAVPIALAVAAITGVIVHRREPEDEKRDRARIAADLPFAADLMVACLQAGQPVSAATDIAAEAVGGPLGQRLSWVSGQLRLGADPEPTWSLLGREPAMGHLSRSMSRAAQSGAPVADVLTRLADDARHSLRAESVAAARRVGVQAVAPLGLCFLPAFVLLGILPVIAGLASTITLP